MFERYRSPVVDEQHRRHFPSPPADAAAEMSGCSDPGPDPAGLGDGCDLSIDAPAPDLDRIFSEL